MPDSIFACKSVLGGWQTIHAPTQTTFGPVFNRTTDLWKWQRDHLPPAAPFAIRVDVPKRNSWRVEWFDHEDELADRCAVLARAVADGTLTFSVHDFRADAHPSSYAILTPPSAGVCFTYP